MFLLDYLLEKLKKYKEQCQNNNNEVCRNITIYELTAKNGNIRTQFPKTLEQCLHFYLNTNFGDYLNTYLDKPKN